MAPVIGQEGSVCVCVCVCVCPAGALCVCSLLYIFCETLALVILFVLHYFYLAFHSWSLCSCWSLEWCWTLWHTPTLSCNLLLASPSQVLCPDRVWHTWTWWRQWQSSPCWQVLSMSWQVSPSHAHWTPLTKLPIPNAPSVSPHGVVHDLIHVNMQCSSAERTIPARRGGGDSCCV